MELYDVVLVPLIVGLVQLLKITGLKKRFLPLASLVFGVLGGVFYIFPQDIKAGILVGIMMGLSASGLYSGGKAMVEKEKEA